MYPKRSRAAFAADDKSDTESSRDNPQAPSKRPRFDQLDRPFPKHQPRPLLPLPESHRDRDRISALSDELLLRILSFLDLSQLLDVSLVSRRLGQLSSDSHLWKALYYARFVLPRAMRIPGFRDLDKGAGGVDAAANHHRLHYTGRRTLWADGRRGGIVRDHHHRCAATAAATAEDPRPASYVPGQLRRRAPSSGRDTDEQGEEEEDDDDEAEERQVDWTRQYKIRHNWSQGKCAVEELKLADGAGDHRKMLVKIVEGIAVTADRAYGLRAWDLKTKELLAQASLREEGAACAAGDEGESSSGCSKEEVDGGGSASPTCLAVDDQNLDRKTLDVAIGFLDGSFGVWRLHTAKAKRRLERQYRHERSSNGKLIGMAYSHPYLLTATEAVHISLYTFDGGPKPTTEERSPLQGPGSDEGVGATSASSSSRSLATSKLPSNGMAGAAAGWPPPYLLSSLKSHTSSPPLALSLRSAGSTTIASIAYKFLTRQGWSIGIQDLHVSSSPAAALSILNKPVPEITSTRLAYTAPMVTGNARGRRPPPATPRRLAARRLSAAPTSSPLTGSDSDSDATASNNHTTISASFEGDGDGDGGPTTLCYTHPYLLATLPDNTLVLHLCNSSASSLTISPGIRLWGHTSGISDAEITSRGRAVSVSTRGEEMRVWELEGGRSSKGHYSNSSANSSGSGSGNSASTAAGGRTSIEIRAARSREDNGSGSGSHHMTGIGADDNSNDEAGSPAWEERRDWVGFDDEMVIVLKERASGGDSLMVYDFT